MLGDAGFFGPSHAAAPCEVDAQGRGKDPKDCMRRFRAAWDKLSSDPAWLTEFLREKRKRL